MKKYSVERSARRVQVEMPVHLDRGEGITRDVASSGLYFYTDQPLPLGTTFDFTLEFRYIRPGEQIQLCCRGEVVRIEDSGEKKGVAAVIKEFLHAA